jgi:sporulation protein YlmC with PRC-barrel domain
MPKQRHGCIKMAKVGKPLTRNSLISTQVIDANGHLVGKVADIAFEVGKSGVSLAVETEKGETKIVEWAEVQAASDFIILKSSSLQPEVVTQQQATQQTTQEETTQPQETTQQQTSPILIKQKTPPVCPLCSRPLTWIPQYKRYYCYNDKKYF